MLLPEILLCSFYLSENKKINKPDLLCYGSLSTSQIVKVLRSFSKDSVCNLFLSSCQYRIILPVHGRDMLEKHILPDFNPVKHVTQSWDKFQAWYMFSKAFFSVVF